MTTHQALFKGFETCAKSGFISRLGITFAKFISGFESTKPCVLLCCALVAELESRGHTCLDLEELAGNPCEKFAMKNEHWAELCKGVHDLPTTVEDWVKELACCAQVFVVGRSGKHEGQPLVLHGTRIYLRKHWQDETRIARAVHARVTTRREVDETRVAAFLDRLFDAGPDGKVDWQKVACAIAVRSTFSIITGGPGTGKTYSVASLLALLLGLAEDPDKLKVAMAAPAGKAAARLQESIDKALLMVTPKVKPEVDMEAFRARMANPQTLHSLIGLNPETRTVRNKASRPLDVDVLIVDEASMAHLEMMALILDALPPQAMLIVLGDKDQLSSVEAGSVLGDLCFGADKCHYTQETADYILYAAGQRIPSEFIGSGSPLAQQVVMLRQSRRFKGPIGALAMAVNAGDGAAAAALMRACTQGSLFAPTGNKATDSRQMALDLTHGSMPGMDYFALLDEPQPRDKTEQAEWLNAIHWFERNGQEEVIALAMDGRVGAPASYGTYFAALADKPDTVEKFDDKAGKVLLAFDRFRVLCAVRDGKWGVAGMNAAVEAEARKRRLLKGSGQWYHGRPVIVTRTDRSLGISNGDVGVCLSDPRRDGSMRVFFPQGEGVRSISSARLSHVETAFAMTVHKVQGSEFEHVALVLPDHPNPIVARELVYTGITRAKTHFSLLTPNPGMVAKAIEKTTDRTSGLRGILDEVLKQECQKERRAA